MGRQETAVTGQCSSAIMGAGQSEKEAHDPAWGAPREASTPGSRRFLNESAWRRRRAAARRAAGQPRHQLSECALSSKRGGGATSTSAEDVQGSALAEVLLQMATPALKLLKL